MSALEQDDQKNGLDAEASGCAAGDANPDYQVGYKRPPQQTRFKPGRLGNPKGRPKGTPNHRTTVNKVMNEKVLVREGGKKRRVTKFETMLQAQANKGMNGDGKSAATLFNIMGKTGLFRDPDEAIKDTCPETKPDPISATEDIPRPGDHLFDSLHEDLLSKDELGELSWFAEKVDERGFAALSTAEFERFQWISKKGQGKDRAAA